MRVPVIHAIAGLIILATSVILTVSVFRNERCLEALVEPFTEEAGRGGRFGGGPGVKSDAP